MPKSDSAQPLSQNVNVRPDRFAPLAVKTALVAALALLRFTPMAAGQTSFSDNRPRLLLDAETGTDAGLGYKGASFSVGPAIEIPVAKRFEIQLSGQYSPDKKAATGNGELAEATGSFVGFATQRVGFIATLERGWLWTSQFDKGAYFPSAGVVIRNDYLGHGRLYLTYMFPTGCVWATPTNPCSIQSNRVQGITLHQDTRSFSHTRWGFEGGLYNYCLEANPNEPQTGRVCRWGATARAMVRFEFHVGNKSRFTAGDVSNPDNFWRLRK